MPIASVERRIEDAYSTIEIGDGRRRQIEQTHQQRVACDAHAREQRCAKLDEQSTLLASRQEKLLDLYYSDGIARETLVKEQQKLSQESTRINEERSLLQDTDSAVRRMSELLDFLDGAHARYVAATSDARKQTNNVLLSRTLIGPDDEDLRFELRDEVAEILTV